jgi:tetratricopeptide (TPR) repeat protein
VDVGVSRAPIDSKAGADAPLNRVQAVTELEKQLAATPRAIYPYQHAGIAYRLGLAYAESIGNDQTAGLRKALACYELAASIFEPRYDPVPHARVLNAAGAAHRALGDRARAADLFEKAAAMLAGHGRDDERGAALNNLGLVRAELGQTELAVEACDEAVALFDDSTPDGRRARAASLHTRGTAHAAMGTEDALLAALADYDEALTVVGPAEAPYHYGIVQHALGVASISLAEKQPAVASRLLGDASGAISESLTIFTRVAFPYQYALGKHNLGLAVMRRALLVDRSECIDELRWALTCFEETVSILDPRLYPAEWQMGYTNLDQVQKELADRGFVGTRAEHFAALLASSSGDGRVELLRERMTRLLLAPEPHRQASLVELDEATARLDYEAARMIITAELGVLMELPGSDLQTGLEARFQAHQRLADPYRETADRALDQAIGDALGGPQRMYVRDFLYGLGWERP